MLQNGAHGTLQLAWLLLWSWPLFGFIQRLEDCHMERPSLTDADISSQRIVSRRTLLRSLGIGAAAVATIVGAEAADQEQTKPKPADPCRDTDRHVNDQDGGCPSDATS